MLETTPVQPAEFLPLDIKVKNHFQIELMRIMGVKEHEHNVQFEWVKEYAERVSDLITFDSEIRPLVESKDKEKWREAIKLVKERLEIET